MNDNLLRICNIIDDINLKLSNIEAQVDAVSDLAVFFGSVELYQSVLEENFKNFESIMNGCISRLRNMNAVIKDCLEEDYNVIFNNLNTGCEDLLEEASVILKHLDANDDTGTASVTNGYQYGNTNISRLEEKL